MARYSFLELAREVIKKVRVPLTEVEIWNKSIEFGLDKKINTLGKTPWKSISARIYVDIRDNESSSFVKVGKRPTKFYLKELPNFEENNNGKRTNDKEIENEKKFKFKERDLHPFLVKYLNGDVHFKSYSKTIYHESSYRRTKGVNKWLHPDIVSIYYPFQDYESQTTLLQKSLNSSRVKLFSFEMKIHIDISNLREYYFQAVSNSSWAHEGYLVCYSIDESVELLDEIRRLNNSFGIGLIKLDVNEVSQSEVLYTAKESTELDWDTIDRLVSGNKDFKKFMETITEDLQLGKVKNRNDYDEIFDDETLLNKLT